METKEKIFLALDEIRPFLQTDGGDIEFIDLVSNEVFVKLIGNCSDCSINRVTMKTAVETTIKKHAPEILKVTNITQ